MPRFHKLRTLPHSSQVLFDLVLDVESYPEFLPWCLKATVCDKTHDTLTGILLVGTKLVHSSFTSLVHFDSATGVISTEARSPLFSHFHSRWTITPEESCQSCSKDLRGKLHGDLRGEVLTGTSSTVDFFVDFEMCNLPFKGVFESLFQRASLRMVEAFERRATALTCLLPLVAQ